MIKNSKLELSISGIVFFLLTISITLKYLAYSMLNNPSSFDKTVYSEYYFFGMLSIIVLLLILGCYLFYANDKNSLSEELYNCERYGKVSGYFNNNALHEKAGHQRKSRFLKIILIILILSYTIFSCLSFESSLNLTGEKIKLHKTYTIISDIIALILLVIIICLCIQIKKEPKFLEKQLFDCEKDGKISRYYDNYDESIPCKKGVSRLSTNFEECPKIMYYR